MPFFDPIRIGSAAASGAASYSVERSLRFNNDDSAYLNRQYAQEPTSQYKMTFSCWVKRCSSDSGVQAVIGVEDNWESPIGFSNDSFRAVAPNSSVTYITTAKYRDFSAWMHVMTVYDTQNSTGADRMICYINGERLTDFSTSGTVPQNTVSARALRSGYNTYIAKDGAGAYGDMYCAEVNVIDGQALTPSDFTETNSITGQLIPKEYTGSYGTNGFYLNFSDTSSLGADSSGNGNNFTPNNFSVTAGAGNDSASDTPTNNFCTLNPLDKNSNVTASDGNLKATSSSSAGHFPIFSTFGMKGGKWYVELRNENNSNWRHAIINIQHDGGSLNQDSTVANNTSAVNKVGYGLNVSNGQKMHDTDTGSSYGSALSGTSDVLQCAVDLDNGKIYWGINNTWFNSGDPAAGSNPAFSGIDTTITWTFAHHIFSNNGCTVNFGQQGFTYTPPSGFKALSLANLPDPTILLPNKHFGTLLYTGDGTDNRLVSDTSAVNFTPDYSVIKTRNFAYGWWANVDIVRGVSKFLRWNLTDAEATNAAPFNSFNNGGFTVSSNIDTTLANKNNETYVAYNWKGGGSASSNSDGDITSQVSANTTAGFSIVGYTGNGTNNSDVTIGHGLGVSPQVVIVKNRDGSNRWQTWHYKLSSDGTYTTKNILLNSTAAESGYSSQIKQVSSTTFTVRDVDSNGNANVNKSGDDYIAYVFSEVEGYSKFGLYNGNSSDDGPFVYTGFRPAWLLVKRRDGTTNWCVLDNKRDPDNVVNTRLFPNSTSGDSVSSGNVSAVDFLSNGFKVRDSHQDGNSSSGEYIYLAFGESPFKYSRAR